MGYRHVRAAAATIVFASLAGCSSDTFVPQNPARTEKSAPPRPQNPRVERVRDSANVSLPKPAVRHRNPFTFEDNAGEQSAGAPLPAGESAGSLPELPLPVPGSDLRLIGIAGGQGPDSKPTAIVTVDNDLVLAKTGDTISERYRVVSVSEDSLDVIDAVGKQPRHLSIH